jgi:hypothetical protein
MRHDDPLQTDAPYAPGGDATDSDAAPIPSGAESRGRGGMLDADDPDDLSRDEIDDEDQEELGI